MTGDIRKILHPTDFSSCAAAALEQATEWARDHKATLIVAHVCPHPEEVEDVPSSSPRAPSAAAAKLDAVVPSDPSVPCVHFLLYGDPAESIVKLAEDEGVGLIIMGSRGHSGLAEALGSVSACVNRNAPCAVVTVDPPAVDLANTA